MTRVFGPFQDPATHLFEELAEQLRFLLSEFLDHWFEVGRLEAIVRPYESLPHGAGTQGNDPAVVFRGLAVNKTKLLQPVEVFAARCRRDPEGPGELTDLEIRFCGDELEETELGSGQTVRWHPVQKILFQELAQKGSQDMSGPQEALEVFARPTRVCGAI